MEREFINRANWEKSIRDAKVRIGLQCHLKEEEEEEEEEKKKKKKKGEEERKKKKEKKK